MSSSSQDLRDKIEPQELEATVDSLTLSSPQPPENVRSYAPSPAAPFLPLTGEDIDSADHDADRSHSPTIVVQVRNPNLASRDGGNDSSPLNPSLFQLMDERLDRRRSAILQQGTTDLPAAFQRLLRSYDALVVEKRNVEAQYAREYASNSTQTSSKQHIRSLERKIQALENEKTELERQNEHSGTERGAVEAMNQFLGQKIDFLEAQLQEVAEKSDNEAASAKIRSLEDKLRKVSGELEVRQRELGAVNDQKDMEIDQLERRLHETEREIADVATFLAGSTARCEELVSDLFELNDKNVQQQQEIDKLRARVAQDSGGRHQQSLSEAIRQSHSADNQNSPVGHSLDLEPHDHVLRVTNRTSKDDSNISMPKPGVETTLDPEIPIEDGQPHVKSRNLSIDGDDKSERRIEDVPSPAGDASSRDRILHWREKVVTSTPGPALTDAEAHSHGTPSEPSPQDPTLEPTGEPHHQTQSPIRETSGIGYGSERTNSLPVYGQSGWFGKAKTLLSPLFSRDNTAPDQTLPSARNMQELSKETKDVNWLAQDTEIGTEVKHLETPSLSKKTRTRSVVRHSKPRPLSLSAQSEQTVPSPKSQQITSQPVDTRDSMVTSPLSPTNASPHATPRLVDTKNTTGLQERPETRRNDDKSQLAEPSDSAVSNSSMPETGVVGSADKEGPELRYTASNPSDSNAEVFETRPQQPRPGAEEQKPTRNNTGPRTGVLVIVGAQENLDANRPVSRNVENASHSSQILTQLPRWRDNIQEQDLSILYTSTLPELAQKELQQWGDRYIFAQDSAMHVSSSAQEIDVWSQEASTVVSRDPTTGAASSHGADMNEQKSAIASTNTQRSPPNDLHKGTKGDQFQPASQVTSTRTIKHAQPSLPQDYRIGQALEAWSTVYDRAVGHINTIRGKSSVWLSRLDTWQWVHLFIALVLLTLVFQVHQAREFWREANTSQARGYVLGWRETQWESTILRVARRQLQGTIERHFGSKQHFRLT